MRFGRQNMFLLVLVDVFKTHFLVLEPSSLSNVIICKLEEMYKLFAFFYLNLVLDWTGHRRVYLFGN